MKISALSAFTWLIGLIGAQGQDYAIDWWTLDSGGGTSTGGAYAITGTIGQPDSGALEGGNYTLVGGFWGVAAGVQAASIEISRANGQLVVSWLKSSAGYVLDHTPAFNGPTPRWSQVDLPYLTNDTHISVVVPASEATGFYRLRR